MATNGATNGSSALPPEAIAFATRMYNAARQGQMDIFQQALPAGLPANMTNEKGDSLVSQRSISYLYTGQSLICITSCFSFNPLDICYDIHPKYRATDDE